MSKVQEDSIVRSVVLAADRETVWRAISSDDGLAGWLAETATVDLRPGGEGLVSFAGGHERRLRVDTVESGETIQFHWSPRSRPGDETRVELRLEDAGDGATRLTVTESGFGRTTAHAGRMAVSAWAWEAALVALVALLVLVAVA
ncbi:MAG: SRPBCC domain-containing protein [Gaiellales bacterium]